MANRRRLQLEGEATPAALNILFAQIADRLDRLEGKSGERTAESRVTLDVGAGTNLIAANMSFNRYGDDLEKCAIAAGAYMDNNKQWIASQTIATIIEMDTTKNIKYYYDTGLTAGVPFTPTLELTVAL